MAEIVLQEFEITQGMLAPRVISNLSRAISNEIALGKDLKSPKAHQRRG